ncbi:MFS general substrate transporter [Aureobasidium sp. EXF-3400]|nr:MFS general substrate transporter [Aureobasidium sp. EXF-12344]KAI4779771.1 MFS general substrate transporter [Aureobasidium sp. EXF-3400]
MSSPNQEKTDDAPRNDDMSIKEKAISPETTEVDIKAGEIVGDLDAAEVFLRNHNFSHAYLHELLQDEVACKKLVRKINWTLMPLLCGTYLLQYIDKQALSYAAVFDLFTSTKTTSEEYSWLTSIFYFGYLVSEWPSSYLAQHFPTGKVLSAFVTTWGCVLMLTAACSNFTGLAICRFILGCLEAPITPCFMLIVGMWFTRKEQPARAGIFYCFNGVGSMTGGILFYGVGQLKGFPVWRVIFLLCGGLTIIWGIALFFLLPNNIMTAKFFSNEEKALLIARSQTNRTGVYSPKIKISQVKEALLDPQVWLLFLFVLCNEGINGGFANFGKLIVKGIAHGDALKTTAYGIPSGAFQVFFVFTGPFLASKFKNIRTYVMALYLLPTIIGTSLVWKLPRSNSNGLLVSYYLAQIGSFVSSLVLALQMPANNVAGYTKRVTATAFVFLAYCIGNICGPHAFLATEAPVYQTGCKFIIACAVVQMVLVFALRALLVRRNKKRDAEFGQVSDMDTSEEMIEDLTDFENPRFRYTY